MKDLYTFDYNAEQALVTYEATREAYKRIFDTLKVPYLVAAADSGNMGGNLSHEFHFISDKGEDTLISCSNCDYVYNEEVSDGRTTASVTENPLAAPMPSETGVGTDNPLAISMALWTAISKDKKTLVRAWYPRYSTQDLGSEPREREINSHAVKAVAKSAGVDLDTSVENPVKLWYEHVKNGEIETLGSYEESARAHKILDLYDSQVAPYSRPPLSGLPEDFDKVKHPVDFALLNCFPGSQDGFSLTRVIDGEKCPKCSTGSLHTHNAVELGHTFYLGTRYSEVLNAKVFVDDSALKSKEPISNKSQKVPMEMGCHGIGVSRMISAVADACSDVHGLNWPRAIAPFEIVVVPGRDLESEAENVYDHLRRHTDTSDVILDDRAKKVGWKLKDADMIGYPVIVVVGKAWQSSQKLEVHCRQLDGLREDVPVDNLVDWIRSLLEKL
ncbi:uncharacterized protein BHQ10_001650 [Talaromyces amestolkiae]|uniref:Anticodon-binding domain-containing protein n=1 Tax=Talaromyces amestolkiae TaxID=1196081 RepID=A0A364KQ11_TALAM|nr:uncharacterized protein BHQ10_001650 [Talaromyces amestolkiae]RAO65638.1 hypothetical protein BHQ10_001650 [Talaromyces amestolkiae]